MGSASSSEPGAGDPRRSSLGRDYWLRRCEGFLVETASKRIGRVAGIRYGTSQDRPEALAVRAGWVRRKLLLVSVEEIERVDPEGRRVVLRDAARLLSE